MFSTIDALARLKNGGALSFNPVRGILRIFGPEAESFLHRLSTNDVKNIAPHQAITSAFTDNKGRLVEHGVILKKSSEDFLVLGSAPTNQILADWLEQFHFAEEVEFDHNCDVRFCYLITSSFEPMSDQIRLVEGTLASTPIMVSLIVGAPPKNAQAIDEKVWESLRVALLIPSYPQEINQKYMPQDLSLFESIADNKGCYIGQEVIAKARTYQKNVKALCGASLSREEFAHIHEGSVIIDASGQQGEITSKAPVYLEHEANALVVVSSRQMTSPAGAHTLQRPLIRKKSQ